MNNTVPRWDLSNVYPGLDSPEFDAALEDLSFKLVEIEKLFSSKGQATDKSTKELVSLFESTINQINSCGDLADTLSAYIYSFVAIDSRDHFARRRLSEFEFLQVRFQKCMTKFKAWARKHKNNLETIIQANPVIHAHAFAIQQASAQAKYQMSNAKENLASELSPSGISAWGKLQGTITSQLSVDFELNGEVQNLPLPAIINLHSHPDETIRHRAYDAELNLLKTVIEPLAACMNGVKGTQLTLYRERKRKDALHFALDEAHIERPTLEAMLSAMRASFPTFRRYFQTKANRLGKKQLAWWDLYAPVGKVDQTFTFKQAEEIISENFYTFSDDLAAFARRAFSEKWIDAEPRTGKTGGAFCMGLPLVKESRILSNFDGSLDQISTVAHELGHAFHNDCAYKAGKTMLQRNTPMTLAETASILCETIVNLALLNNAASADEELSVLEKMLIGDAQVIIDISSRYFFEQQVFEKRAKAELSPEELCALMVEAQKATYGDGLDASYLNPMMWAWKPHYYFDNLPFYNFPYAFGLLFGIGLYDIFRQVGPSFITDYKKLLASTGEAKAEDLAMQFGINIRDQSFWDGSLKVIEKRIDRYCQL